MNKILVATQIFMDRDGCRNEQIISVNLSKKNMPIDGQKMPVKKNAIDFINSSGQKGNQNCV